MPRTERETEKLAREAAERVDRDLEQGKQLGLLPDVPEPHLPEPKGSGRPPGSKNKGSSQMREWMAARGLRMPEEVIAEVAGLQANGKDAFNFALAQTERLLGHVGQSAVNRIFKVGEGHVTLDGPWQPSPAEFIDTFKFFYGQARQAAADLMPYGTPKVTPDTNINQSVNVIVPTAPSQPADRAAQARDVTPSSAARMVPADVKAEMQRKQEVRDEENDNSDAEIRTDEASD
ncbi:hypothetical protein [Roseovarius atlanticus]|uniref:hypothetical protein n=1 Tax=Roseovarius atlanticus TaxID=1641875 RepID=UPI001C97E69F|nr:hypothetical protein [Roseovarius atlanticus]MBY5988203.1 hypothetical protein [Roseovarius atlanticus]MBY6123594.1 hypothetical protein [Roseovarius atlanticus]MBY6148089.1 hypothetical protein [Roseovarius atlanticus]